MVSRPSRMDGWWFGRLRYIRRPAVAPSVLTHLTCSQWSHFDSLWVTACTDYCIILTTSSATSLVSVSIALVLLVTLNVSPSDLLASMTFWPGSSTWCVHFIDALVSDPPRTLLDAVISKPVVFA